MRTSRSGDQMGERARGGHAAKSIFANPLGESAAGYGLISSPCVQTLRIVLATGRHLIGLKPTESEAQQLWKERTGFGSH